MRSRHLCLAFACAILCLPKTAACQESSGPDPSTPGYELTSAAILVDLRTEPYGACLVVEVRNRSPEPIRRVEILPYSKELARSIVYAEISSESIDSPEPIVEALFSAAQVLAEGDDGPRRLFFKLSRDLEPADVTWLLIGPADESAPLVTIRRTGAELSVESTAFAANLDKMVIGLVSSAEDRLEFRTASSGYVSGATLYEGVLLTNQVSSLSKLLGAAAGMWHGDPVLSWPAAAYFGSTQPGATRRAGVVFLSLEETLGTDDRGWVMAAATLSGGAVIVAVLVALGRRSSSKKAGR